MWELGHEEGWVPKNWCFWTVVLEKTLESPLDCKEIQPVSPKGNQPWTFIVRIDAEAETPMLWPSDVKSHLIGKDPDAGKDWGQEEKGATGQDGWMASLTQWTWVWASSKRWWRTGEPGVLQSMGSQSVKTERLNSILGKHISETITTINTTYIYHLQKFPLTLFNFCVGVW